MALGFMPGTQRGSWVAVALLIATVAGAQTASDFNRSGYEEYQAGRYDAALTAFLEAYERAPSDKTVRHNLCNTYQALANEEAKKGNLEQGARLLENAIGIEPSNAAPLVQLGSYYLRLDLVADAAFRLEEAVELEPGNITARDLLGTAYYRSNELAAALDHWAWVKEQDPDRLGLVDKMAKAQRELNVENEFRDGQSRHFQIRFAPGTSGSDYRGVLQELERAYRELGQRLGRIYPPGPIQVIVYTAEEFSEVTMLADHVGALYDGKIRVPLFDKAGIRMEQAELKRRLYHEYTHVLVRYMAQDNVPWWFNEGTAQLMSEDYEASDRERVTQAYEAGRLFRLQELEANQLSTLRPDAIRDAYAQSHAAVKLLHDRFGKPRFLRFLTILGNGTSPADALRQVYRRSYDDLDRELERSIIRY